MTRDERGQNDPVYMNLIIQEDYSHYINNFENKLEMDIARIR